MHSGHVDNKQRKGKLFPGLSTCSLLNSNRSIETLAGNFPVLQVW